MGKLEVPTEGRLDVSIEETPADALPA